MSEIAIFARDFPKKTAWIAQKKAKILYPAAAAGMADCTAERFFDNNFLRLMSLIF